MLWNAKEERMKPRMHVENLKQETRNDVEAAVSLAIHQGNRSLAGERAKGIFLTTRAKAHQVPEELRLLVLLFLDRAACLPIHR